MAVRRALLLPAVVAGVLTLGCGAGAAKSQSTAPGAGDAATTASAAASAQTSGTSGAIPVVTRAHVDSPAATVVVDVTVTGPAELLGGCQPTLTVHLVDSAGHQLAEPSPLNAVRCLAITNVPVAPGQTLDFTASVGLPAAHGTYTVTGQLNGAGPIPTVTIAV